MGQHIKVKKILVLTMGGTIDSEPYDTTPYHVRCGEKSRIPATLRKIVAELRFPEGEGFKVEFEYVAVCNKDSKAVTEEDLRKAASAIQDSDASDVIITFGTDAMVDKSIMLEKILAEEKTEKYHFFF